MGSRSKTKAQKKGRMKFFGLVVILMVLIIIFVNFVHSGFTSKTQQLSAYSDKWNDLSKFRESIEKLGYSTASIISSPTMLNEIDDIENTLFIAVGIEREYTITESRVIYEFIRAGGTAIIADDYGYANSVSEFFFDVTFLGSRLWDQEYEKNPQFVKIDVDPERNGRFYFDGTILFNNPTALVSNAGELASSTNLSWVDMNRDGVQNIEEVSRPYPVVVRKDVDEGSIVFISDPSPFINDMWNRLENSDFIIALVQHLVDAGGNVIFDESRHIRDNPIDNSRMAVYEALVILTTDDQLRWLTAIVTILVLGLLVITYDDPYELKHIYNIGKFKIRELKEPWLGPSDTDRMRYIFLERVRIHLGLSLEDFRDLTKDDLEELIGDETLSDFALTLGRLYSGSDIINIFNKVKNWPVPIPDDKPPVEVEPIDEEPEKVRYMTEDDQIEETVEYIYED